MFVCWVSPLVYRHMIGQNLATLIMLILITVMKVLTKISIYQRAFSFSTSISFCIHPLTFWATELQWLDPAPWPAGRRGAGIAGRTEKNKGGVQICEALCKIFSSGFPVRLWVSEIVEKLQAKCPALGFRAKSGFLFEARFCTTSHTECSFLGFYSRLASKNSKRA